MNHVGSNRTFIQTLGVVAALLSSFLSYGTALASPSEYKPGELIVKYKNGVMRNKATMDGIYESASVQRVMRMRGIMHGIEQLILREGTDVMRSVSILRSNPDVEYAQPNYIMRALPVRRADARRAAPSDGPSVRFPCIIPGVNFPPGCTDWDFPGGGGGGDSRPTLADRPEEKSPPEVDPDIQEAYGLSKMGADRAWGLTSGSGDFIVGVIDTGIDYNHEDLAFNVWRNQSPSDAGDVVGYDFIHDDGLPFDDNQHGSHCAGVIGATGGNGIGISGINPRVSIMALKFLSAEGGGDTAGAIRAIDYGVSHGAKVLSNSWGGGSALDNQGLEDAIQRASDAGVLFIAAAGNESNNNDRDPSFPAAYRTPNMIAVAATDQNDALASFSNTGVESVHLAAPGVRVYSTVPGNRYSRLSGTSMACPHVAGAAALLWSTRPELSMAQVKEKLLSTVDQVAGLSGKVLTGGRLNVYRALTE